MADRESGRNFDREIPLPTAYDVKEINRQLASDFTDDDLKQIPILPTGAPLERDATYLDLAVSPREAFRPNMGLRAEVGHYFVPKARTPYDLWNRLVGRPERGG